MRAHESRRHLMRGKANHFCVTRLLGPFESSIFFFIYLLFHRVFTIISVKINPIAANSSDDFMKAIIPETNAPVAIVSHIKCLFLVFMKVPFLFRFSFVWLPLSLPYNVVPFSPFIISITNARVCFLPHCSLSSFFMHPIM